MMFNSLNALIAAVMKERFESDYNHIPSTVLTLNVTVSTKVTIVFILMVKLIESGDLT